jgi:N-acetylglucosamine-6-phosphate deacetylase
VIALRAGCALTPTRTISPAHVLIEDGKIVAVGLPFHVPVPSHAEIVAAEPWIVVPGFIDTHTHGHSGSYFGEDVATTAGICRSITATGVTGLLPTLSGLRPGQDTLEMILERVATLCRTMMEQGGGAEILGIHMEGPYLSDAAHVRGSQRVESLRRPALAELHRMVQAAGGHIRKMSVAPELDGALALISELRRLGIVASGGHSAASYDQASAAADAGMICATHVFNGMPPLHHRQPGLLAAVLTDDRIHAELIADGQHVSAPAMQVLLRCKGVDRIHLITDNTTWAGMPNGVYPDGERTIVKEDERVYVVGGTLIGSVAPMNACVRNMARLPGCSLAEAVQMASLNPADLIGLAGRKGSLEPGCDADLVVIDDAVNVHMVMVRGRQVYGNCLGLPERPGVHPI